MKLAIKQNLIWQKIILLRAKNFETVKLFLYFLKILDTIHIKLMNKEKKNTLM